MHVKARMTAFSGLLLALSVVCMSLGSVIETNTLFLLAAASFLRGDCHPGIRDESGRGFLCSGRPAGIFRLLQTSFMSSLLRRWDSIS